MTYKAGAIHDPPWWAISITEGLPDHMFAHTQARRLNKIEPTARAVIAELTGVDPSEVEVKVTIRMPEPVAAAQEENAALKAQRENQAVQRSSAADAPP